jgi:hypothetical protein
MPFMGSFENEGIHEGMTTINLDTLRAFRALPGIFGRMTPVLPFSAAGVNGEGGW